MGVHINQRVKYQGGTGTRVSPVWRIFTVAWTLPAVCELRRKPLPRTRVNRGKKEGSQSRWTSPFRLSAFDVALRAPIILRG
jgi:hypothetical protein